MIYDTLENIEKYRGCSVWLDEAIDFLKDTDLHALPLGKTEICENHVFANVMDAQTTEERGKFEIHKKYMDIQIDLEGVEEIQIGLDHVKESLIYDPQSDFGTVECTASASCIMGPGRFIICMSEEPHRPGMIVNKRGLLKKCVIKVQTA